MLLAVVGMPGSGKSEAARFLEKKLGFKYLRFGDVVETMLRKEKKEINEVNEREMRERLREEGGMAAMAKAIEVKLAEVVSNEEKVVLDGLYSWEEYEYLKEKYEDLKLVCVYAAPEVRYKRLAVRRHRSLNDEEAKSRDAAELQRLNKGGPIAMADFLVVNEGSLQELYKQLEKLIKLI